MVIYLYVVWKSVVNALIVNMTLYVCQWEYGNIIMSQEI